MGNEKALQELKSAEELHRFEAGMMLGQTTVYLLVIGGLLGASKNNLQFIRIGIAIFGFLISLAFMFIVQRTGENLGGARKRAEELGSQLNFKLYSQDYIKSTKHILSGRNITRFICIAGGILWVVVFFMTIFE